MKSANKVIKRNLIIPTSLFLAFVFVSNFAVAYDGSGIKQKIISNSISKYKGSCPCPYSTMKNGKSCGGRSAYSKPKGKSPICYESDVTQKMIDGYK